MAFNAKGFVVISSSGSAKVVNLEAAGTTYGGPGLYTYTSDTDSIAVIAGANYFKPVANIMNVGDIIWIVDNVAASGLYELTAVNLALGLVTIAHTGGLGDVIGPGVSTATALAVFADVSGMVLANSVALLSALGNLTGLTGLTVGGVIFPAGPGAVGQVLELGAGGQLVFANPTANVWVDAIATPTALVANTSYVADTAGLLTFNMPAVVPFGSVFNIAGNGAGGWVVQLSGGQTAHLGSATTSAGGTITATAPANRYSSLSLLCTVANTTFVALNGFGTTVTA